MIMKCNHVRTIAFLLGLQYFLYIKKASQKQGPGLSELDTCYRDLWGA